MGSRIPIILDARSLFEAPVWRRRSIEDDRRAAAVLDTAIEAGISVVFVDPESHAARRWLARHEVSVVALTGARALAIDGREARLVDVDLLRQGDYRAEIEHAASAGLDVVAAEPSLSFRPRGAAPPTKLSPAIVREIEEDDARWRIVDAVRAIAAAHHTSPACVAIAWTLAVRGVGSVIVRASETDTRPWWLDAVALLSPAEHAELTVLHDDWSMG